MSSPSRLKANTLLILVAFIWGTAFIAQSVAVQAGLAFLYNGASFVLGGLALLPFAPKGTMLSRPQWRWMLAAGLLLFGGSALQQVGLFYTKVANASFLTTLYVIFTPFLLWAGYGDRPKKIELLGVVLAIAGAFLLSTGGAAFTWQIGDILELLGAFFWGLHLVLVAKYTAKFDAISFACGQFLVCGIMNFAVGFVFESPQALLLWPVVAATVYRALLSIGIGYTLQIWAQKFTTATDAGLIFSLEAVFAATVAWAVLGETLGPLQVVGCLLIFVAAFCPQMVK